METAHASRGSSLEPVIYMDDVGVPGEDPNGVQDLAIALVLWGDDPAIDVFDKDDIYPRIAEGLTRIRP